MPLASATGTSLHPICTTEHAFDRLLLSDDGVGFITPIDDLAVLSAWNTAASSAINCSFFVLESYVLLLFAAFSALTIC